MDLSNLTVGELIARGRALTREAGHREWDSFTADQQAVLQLYHGLQQQHEHQVHPQTSSGSTTDFSNVSDLPSHMSDMSSEWVRRKAEQTWPLYMNWLSR